MLVAILSLSAMTLACAGASCWATLRWGGRWPLVLATLLAWSPLPPAAFTGLVSGALGCNVSGRWPTRETRA